MKILFVTQNYYPSKGGMAESCRRIVGNLRKNKLTIHIFHFNSKTETCFFRTENSGSYMSVPIYRTEEYTLNIAAKYLETVSDKIEFDVIVAFGGYLPLTWVPIISKYNSKPYYTFIRGNDFDEFIFSKKREILFYALQNSTAICCVCKEKQIKIKKLFPKVEVFYTPNGIDSSKWILSPKEQEKVTILKEKSLGRKIILLAGQLKFKKGIAGFIDSFQTFPYNQEYEIWLVGDISASLQEYLASTKILYQIFSFATKEEIKQYYAAVDIVCIPSLYDGMPNVLLESAASKKMVIASDTGGMPDVIENKVSGLLYNPLKPNALLEVLLHYQFLKEEDRLKMIDSLHQTVKENFTEKKELNNYLNIIQK
ncbi:glycosyltransferase family 4 protein [Apibacter raozihei]|uniref:glycosyltransferase family 4 protein n=1 Tax=Apibacter raozihei TaxID=2500547 RepID=UPI000FE3CAB7|nr:glycosyltransferase family 4 protein [Apibacter raozihei]